MRTIVLLSFIFFQTVAFAQEGAGIFKFRWFIDKQLTNDVIVTNGNAGNFGVRTLQIPQHLYDSVLSVVKRIAGQELRTDAKYIFPVNRRGKELKTSNGAEYVGNLPRGTRRQAMRSEYIENYVKVKIQVGLNKTVGIGIGVASYSRLRPYVRVKMKSYLGGRKVTYRKTTRNSDFPSLSSFEIDMGNTTVTNTNSMPIEQVLDMVFKGLDKFENKVKL
ncbi:MAG: hypothetical protein V4638_07225 [Bacteroidota bacterium]